MSMKKNGLQERNYTSGAAQFISMMKAKKE